MKLQTITPTKAIDDLKVFRSKDCHFEARIEKFEKDGDYDCYNPSIPFTLNGKKYIFCRTQGRTEQYSITRLFVLENDTWKIEKSAPTFKMEDPSVAYINGKYILSGINVIFGDGVNTFTEIQTDYYLINSVTDIKYFSCGPKGMKDIRLIDLENNKIGIFTRPNNEEFQKENNCICKIGFTIVDGIENINALNISNAPLIRDLFVDDEWGGPNSAYMLKNGLIGVIGHKSYKTESKTCIWGDLHYCGVKFALNPNTGKVYGMKIIVTRDKFPETEQREDRLKDVVFSAGVERLDGGKAKLYVGLSDAYVGSAIIDDPFIEYEGEIVE